MRSDENDNKYEEWTKLSRKHEIDVNFNLKHVSIFGGKLTDCLNIGDKVDVKVIKVDDNGRISLSIKALLK